MAKDWEKLAGEKGVEIPSGRLDRMWRVGKLGMGVGVKTALRKAGNLIRPESEKRRAADRDFLATQARDVTRVLGQMKGGAMKIGQLLSSDPDLLPPEFLEELTSLQKEAPPMTWRQVQGQIERAFDQSVESVFAWFDPEPIGSASIGQVHRARLHSGEDVAVKIQYPGVRDSLDADMRNLRTVMTIGRVVAEGKRLDAWADEIKDAILQESDYTQEAANLATYSEFLNEREGVRVPRPYPEWSRTEVLTMEYIEGTKLDEALMAMPDGPEKVELCERFIATYSWMLHDRYQLHCDPHPGNFLLDENGDLVFLDFGCVKDIDVRFADGILDMLDACWTGDDRRASSLYVELGFGGSDADEALFEPTLLRSYHEIVLAPLITDVDFDFEAWEMRKGVQSFMMRHPVLLKWVPPAEGLMVFRVMGGIKGLMTRVGGRINVHRLAVETARRAGRLTYSLPPG